MCSINFEWDENKNNLSKKKHKTSFEEAKTVFYDENALLISDPDHSHDEEQFTLLGMSSKSRIMIVVHIYKKNEEKTRIISARKAAKNEEKFYERRSL